MDPNERAKLYDEMQEIGMKDAFAIPFFQMSEPFVLNSKFTGLEMDNRRRATFWLIKLAKIS
jgi:ABC-type transport system substrate-binding protein